MEKKYDPNKQYSWEQESEFKLSGNEFGFLLNVTRTFLQRPESRLVLLMAEANELIDKKLQEAVETGVAKEIVQEQVPQSPTPPQLKKVEDTKEE